MLNSLIIKPEELEPHVNELQRTYDEIYANERKSVSYLTEDAEIVLTAYGTVARIVKSAVNELRRQGDQGGLHPPRHPVSLPRRGVCRLRRARVHQGVFVGGTLPRPDGGGRAPRRQRQKARVFLRQNGRQRARRGEIVEAAKKFLEQRRR